MKQLLSLVTICFIAMQPTFVQGEKGVNDFSPTSSLIFLPNKASSAHPTIVGILRKSNGQPIKNSKVTIYIDGIAYGIVTTNLNGVFKYQLRSEITLAEGKHCVYGVMTKDNMYVRGSIFTVVNRSTENFGTRSGNVDVSNSGIWFPIDGGYIGSATFEIICGLYDSSNQVVTGETLTFKTDSNIVSDSVISDSDGLGVYTLTAGQALSEGTHTADVHAQESDVDLTQVSFTIDLTAPDAPIVTSPNNDDVLNSSTVIITGTSEINSTVYVFLDGDQNGEITYPDESGNWSIEYDDVADGSHSFYAYQTDEVENQGPNTATINFTVST